MLCRWSSLSYCLFKALDRHWMRRIDWFLLSDLVPGLGFSGWPLVLDSVSGVKTSSLDIDQIKSLNLQIIHTPTHAALSNGRELMRTPMHTHLSVPLTDQVCIVSHARRNRWTWQGAREDREWREKAMRAPACQHAYYLLNPSCRTNQARSSQITPRHQRHHPLAILLLIQTIESPYHSRTLEPQLRASIRLPR